MKLIGISMIISACSLLGFAVAKEYNSVLNGINRAEKLIKTIIFCLHNEHMSIPEILSYIYSVGDNKTKNFIENIEFSSLGNIEETAIKCGFCKDETANSILREVFSVIGKYSAKEQIAELEFCRNKLNRLYENNAEIIKNKAEFSRRFGILAGIFIAVIFI